MFTGESFHALDAKHRVFVPKRFQRELANGCQEGPLQLVLTHGAENCLYLFSARGFEAALQRLRTQAFGGGKELRNMQRRFFSKVHPTQLDASGRVVIPEGFRKYAEIQKEVAMIGAANRGEIWARERWEKFDSEHADLNDMDAILVGDDPFASPLDGMTAGKPE